MTQSCKQLVRHEREESKAKTYAQQGGLKTSKVNTSQGLEAGAFCDPSEINLHPGGRLLFSVGECAGKLWKGP